MAMKNFLDIYNNGKLKLNNFDDNDKAIDLGVFYKPKVEENIAPELYNTDQNFVLDKLAPH